MNTPAGEAASTTDIINRISEMKEDTDVLLQQLSEGEYLSVGAFANNWNHLTRLYSQIQAHMSDCVLMDQLIRRDLLLAADLLAVGRMIAVMDNFLRCAAIPRE